MNQPSKSDLSSRSHNFSQHDIQNAFYVIVGLGKSGKAAEKFLLEKQVPHQNIKTFDEKDSSAQWKKWEDFESGAADTDQNLGPAFAVTEKYLVVSPGVPLQSIAIQNLLKKGWKLTSEINLACSVLKDEIVVGITGSVGKSTVTSLLGEAVLTDDENAFVGGNLGTPFCQYALDRLTGRPKARFVVLELSSYQLENCAALKLDYSAITYFSPNHLERYSSLQEYYKTKAYIAEITKNTLVINSASADLLKYKPTIVGKVIESISADKPQTAPQISLIGKHNLENYFLALSLAQLCKLSPAAIEAMKKFKGLAHRLETVEQFNGILFINDSKATAMDSVLVATQAAMDKVKADAQLYLLLGGKDKNLPWEQLNVLKKNPQVQTIFFGQCGDLAHSKSGLDGAVFSRLAEALNFVFAKAKQGDVVLLSPGGTSLDEFKNFEERGHFFKETVKKHYTV